MPRIGRYDVGQAVLPQRAQRDLDHDLAAVTALGDQIHLRAHRTRPRVACVGFAIGSVARADAVGHQRIDRHPDQLVASNSRATTPRPGLASTMTPLRVDQQQRVGIGGEQRAEDGQVVEAGPCAVVDMNVSAASTGRHENVPRAAYRLDDLRVLGIGFDLPAQPADQDVDRAVERGGIAAACLFEQEVAGQHPSRIAGEDVQKVEFAGGQRHVPAFRVEQAARGGVELPVREAQPRRSTPEPAQSARFGAGASAAQHRLDPRQQLAQVERLGHVVVGADFQADDLVDRVAAAGDDHEAAVPVLAQLARDRKAVFAGQARGPGARARAGRSPSGRSARGPNAAG